MKLRSHIQSIFFCISICALLFIAYFFTPLISALLPDGYSDITQSDEIHPDFSEHQERSSFDTLWDLYNQAEEIKYLEDDSYTKTAYDLYILLMCICNGKSYVPEKVYKITPKLINYNDSFVYMLQYSQSDDNGIFYDINIAFDNTMAFAQISPDNTDTLSEREISDALQKYKQWAEEASKIPNITPDDSPEYEQVLQNPFYLLFNCAETYHSDTKYLHYILYDLINGNKRIYESHGQYYIEFSYSYVRLTLIPDLKNPGFNGFLIEYEPIYSSEDSENP